MNTHNHQMYLRLLTMLVLSLILIVTVFWALGETWVSTTRAGAPARSLLAPVPAGTDPISNALNVPVNSDISIAFDEPVNLASVSTRTFAVYGSQSPIFAGTYSLSNLSRTVTLDPARVFFPGERVDAIITTGILNIDGEQVIYEGLQKVRPGITVKTEAGEVPIIKESM